MKKLNILLTTLSMVLLVLSLNFISADPYDYGNGYCGMMSGFYGGYGWGGMLFSWVIGILVIVALVLLIIWLYKKIEGKENGNRKRSV